MSVTIVIAAGGTGGHLLPGFAVANAIVERHPDARIVFVGTPYGMEQTLVPAAGYEVRTTGVRPLHGGLAAVRAIASVAPATRTARRILGQERAAAVLGMGGYPSVPVLLAARTKKVPTLIHEANAIPGLANEVGARVTPNIAVTFPAAAARFRGRASRVTGMPLRRAIVDLDRDAIRLEARRALGLAPDRTTVLAFGGSLGASSLTDAVLAAGPAWRDAQVLLVAGTARADEAAERAPEGMRVEAFIDRMELAYAAADLVVGRAGASSVCELAAVGLPSVLVPLPHARRKEQHANAAWLASAGGAIVLEDAALRHELGPAVASLLGDPDRRAAMGAAARAVGSLDAAEVIAEWTLRLAGVAA